MATSRDATIREQTEHYLVEAGAEGWVDADFILRCPKMQQLRVTSKELASALQGSTQLDVEGSVDDVSCCVRRKDTFVSRKLQKWKAKGKGKGKQVGAKIKYDPSTPCGYFLAGHCRHSDACLLRHSLPYAEAIRNDWLSPGDSQTRAALRAVAEETLGSDTAESLFPRVFAQRIESKMRSPRAHSDLSDSGFVWEAPEDDTPESPEIGMRYLLVLDLEGKDEIIEFPVILVDVAARRELGRFQRYVRPAKLFHDCSPLTEMSPARPFSAVLEEFDDWLLSLTGRRLQDLGNSDADMAFVTCGDWDCKHVHTQCSISGIPTPPAFAQWVNIKLLYSTTYGGNFRGMKSMLSMLRLLDASGDPKFGFHHNGMHDVENIGRCLLYLLEQDVEIAVNGSIRC
eukprot:TRINITY_DN38582_c0_g1_i1.p1 TRINITY_DN38582_c0_g1~~TRINITY_DN38582_c0_g1_i1.p1  ORF type:complete len:399 (+),score=85.03 TRINITY_DN38582_c0_g1_i1:19-1215(+)